MKEQRSAFGFRDILNRHFRWMINPSCAMPKYKHGDIKYMKYKILIVDDETANLRMLERLFRQEYEPITAESGEAALEMLNRFDVALIISDQRMPGMPGIEFLKKAAEMRPQTVRIILTGYTDVNDLVEAGNSRG